MTRFLKPILCILGGAALGGGISYFLAHREIKKLEETVMYLGNDFVNFRMKYVPKERDEEDYVEKYEHEIEEQMEREAEAEAMFPSNPVNKSIEKPALLELMEKVSNAAQLPVETMFSPITVVDDKPFLVAENAIDLNDDKYDSEVSYTYYKDGILVDELDEIIIDPDDILPSGWRDCFGWNCKSDDVFFAINPKLRLLIEVGKSSLRYSQLTGEYEDDFEE